jgi:host factor-I protein
MQPTKDAAPRPNAAPADAPGGAGARPGDAGRPASGSGTATATGVVAQQRPGHSHGAQVAHGGAHGGGHGGSHGGSHGGGHAAGRQASPREPRSQQGSPNIQDVFLNYARREKLTVVIQLLDGQSVEGRIKNFDRFALVVDHAGVDHLVFKHAIATIRSPRSIGSYYASHEAS